MIMKSLLSLEYRHVDVFSRHALCGNGLVVVLQSDGLSTALQQQLTREVRQFEAAFLSGVNLPGRTARLRVFTEDEELGFAGHPVLGAAAVLHSLLPVTPVEEAWAVELGGRRLTVRTRTRDGWVDASMDQGPAQFGRVVTGELAERYRAALGLHTEYPDLPLQVVSTGLPYLIVPVRTEDLAVAQIGDRGFEALLAESGAKFVYVLDPTELEGRSWDNAGRVEDVATGSAAGPAAGYLFEHGHRRVIQRFGSPRAGSPGGRASSKSPSIPAVAITGWEDRWHRWPMAFSPPAFPVAQKLLNRRDLEGWHVRRRHRRGSLSPTGSLRPWIFRAYPTRATSASNARFSNGGIDLCASPLTRQRPGRFDAQ